MNITPAAGQHLHAMLKNANAPDGAAIRIVPDSGKFTLTTDTPQEGDRVFNDGEQPVLLLDKSVDEMLEGQILDVQSTPEGRALVLAAA